VRNWDYRYCWIRDATFTLYALIVGGYESEAQEWREWLVRAVAGTPAELQIMYGVAGERRLTELNLDWLAGYENSRPVRTGNAAHNQFQLDVYGEVIDTLQVARRSGLRPSEDAVRVQTALLRFVETAWREPDEGIWEMRGPRRHFTHSKVMAWVALDRGIKAAAELGVEGDAARWKVVRDQIREDVFRNGFDAGLNSFVQYYGSKDTDASLLMLPLMGFIGAGEPEMRGTLRFIEQTLLQDGFVHRYVPNPELDGLPPGEGAFLLCSFWYADNLALEGDRKRARDVLERLMDLRNDVGLLPEQFDPKRKRFLGNFPQAFSHVGLINTIRNLGAAGGPAEDRSSGSA
jgi:GH15 family glucan-1,4-alpha-glucosidase